MGHLQGSRYQSASERLLERPTRRYARSRSRTHRPTTQCRPSWSRPSHGVEDSRWFLLSQTASSRSGYPPTNQASDGGLGSRSANGLPTVCHQSDPVRLSATHCSVPGPRGTLGSALSRTPSPVVRSTAVPGGRGSGCAVISAGGRGSTMRIGKGPHPIQVRSSRMMMWSSMYRNDDIEIDGQA